MVATRGRTFKRPWRRSCHSSKLKSSSAPIGRKDSWRFHAVGSSNAPLLGSTAAEGLQRIGRTSTATRWRSCGLPQSASCSENFVIPPDVFGQTLRGNFIRAAAWFSIGSGMLFWWMSADIDFETWLRGSAVIVGMGALGTFVRWHIRHRRAAEVVPPFEPTPVVLNINIELSPHADRRAVHDDLAALASALRGAIGTEQGPRRISG